MAATFDTASVFTLEQLTGQRRQINIIGRALPYRPYGLKTKQRVELTWLPGNPVATATVLGPQEDPSSVNGYWKDKYLGDTQTLTNTNANAGVTSAPLVSDGAPVTTCRDAATLFDAIVREGQLLQVTWDQQVRQGFLVEFDKNWHNVHDLEWSMNFTWISRGEPEVPAVFSQEADLSNLTSTLTADFDSLMLKFGSPGFPFAISPYNELLGELDTISTAVATVQRAVGNLAGLALAPSAAIVSAISSCAGLIDNCDSLLTSLQSRVPGSLNYSTPLGSQLATDRLVTQLWVSDMIDLTRALRYDAVDQEQVLLLLTANDVLAVYTCKDTQDLRDVSRIYYGTPFDWIALQQFNGLKNSQLSAGQVVLIPRDPVLELKL